MPPIHSWHRPPYAVSTDPARLDLDVVHGYLAASYWASGIPRDLVRQSIAGSLAVGVYEAADEGRERQVGFARVITDYATFNYLADVFVLESHRGRGLGVWLVECLLAVPELQSARTWLLATRDAHELYRRFGFTEVQPGRYMAKRRERPYEGG